MGYYPLACAGSRYKELYCYTGLDRHGLGALGGATLQSGRLGAHSGTPRYGLDGPRKSRPRAKACGCVRGLAGGVCHDTIVCIITGGRPGRWMCRNIMSRHGWEASDTVEEAVIRRAAERAGAQRHGAWHSTRHNRCVLRHG